MQGVPVITLDYARVGKKIGKISPDSDGPASGTAAAVRRGKRLMQVQMNNIKTHLGGTGDAKQGVQVSAVVIEKASVFAHEPRDFHDILFEYPQRVGIGKHDSGDLVVKKLF